MLAKADERYAEASERLRKMLGDGKAYEKANAWALWLCNEAAEHADIWQHDPHELSQQNRLYHRDWKNGSASKAALRLARHLEISDEDEGLARVDEAARQSGIRLISDNKEAIDVGFTKMLRALAKQFASFDDDKLGSNPNGAFLHGPLLVIPGKRFSLPSKPMSLAFALIYGFRKVTGAIERKPDPNSFFGSFRRFDLLSGGEPCYEAVRRFVNTAFKTNLKTPTIVKTLNRYKRRVYVVTKLMESVEDDRDNKARK